MIISHRHKFIFVHINKCAGTSITRALLPFLGSDDLILGCSPKHEKLSNEYRNRGLVFKHSTASKIKEFIGQGIWDSYFVFSFVRNPFDIVVSKYFWWHKTPADWSNKAKEQKKAITSLSFNDYILNKKFGPKFSMAAFLKTGNSTDAKPFPEIDFIGKYETLQPDFHKACEQMDLPKINLSMANPSVELRKMKNLKSFYHEGTKAIVESAYQEDLRLFSYTFPD